MCVEIENNAFLGYYWFVEPAIRTQEEYSTKRDSVDIDYSYKSVCLFVTHILVIRFLPHVWLHQNIEPPSGFWLRSQMGGGEGLPQFQYW